MLYEVYQTLRKHEDNLYFPVLLYGFHTFLLSLTIALNSDLKIVFYSVGSNSGSPTGIWEQLAGFLCPTVSSMQESTPETTLDRTGTNNTYALFVKLNNSLPEKKKTITEPGIKVELFGQVGKTLILSQAAGITLRSLLN